MAMIRKNDAVEILPGFGYPGDGHFQWFAGADEDDEGLVSLVHKHSRPDSQYALPAYQLRVLDAPVDSLRDVADVPRG